jgi:hypothetical protein
MLQMNVLGQKRGLLLPTRIRSMRINVTQHKQAQNVTALSNESTKINSQLPVTFDPFTNTTVCGGVEIIGLHATIAPRRQQFQPTILERVSFMPYTDRPTDEGFTHVDLNDSTSLQHNHGPEILEHYLSEIKRYTSLILKKMEQPKIIVQTITAQPFENPQW